MSTSGTSFLAGSKRLYARTMQRTRALHRRSAGVVPDPAAHRWRHWWRSLPYVYDSLALARLGVPWWTYDAIVSIDEWIYRQDKPLRAFEYGSGASTLWLAERVSAMVSVEHDAEFGRLMLGALADRPNVELHVVEPKVMPEPSTPSAKEGYDGCDFTDYVRTIRETEGEFDLIVIDGRAREACLTEARPRLAQGGIIVFDNSRRGRYRRAIEESGLTERVHRGLTPSLPYPEQTSVLS